MPYLIDGYNLLWAVQKFVDEVEPLTDVTLCRMIAEFLRQVREKGEVIFDGIGPPDKTGFFNTSYLDIYFSGTHIDADSLIEIKIKKNTAPKNLTVVSSDNRLRKAAKARKSVSVRSDEFWILMNKQFSKSKPIREPAEKRNGLTKGETEEWMKYFKIE